MFLNKKDKLIKTNLRRNRKAHTILKPFKKLNQHFKILPPPPTVYDTTAPGPGSVSGKLLQSREERYET